MTNDLHTIVADLVERELLAGANEVVLEVVGCPTVVYVVPRWRDAPTRRAHITLLRLRHRLTNRRDSSP